MKELFRITPKGTVLVRLTAEEGDSVIVIEEVEPGSPDDPLAGLTNIGLMKAIRDTGGGDALGAYMLANPEIKEELDRRRQWDYEWARKQKQG